MQHRLTFPVVILRLRYTDEILVSIPLFTAALQWVQHAHIRRIRVQMELCFARDVYDDVHRELAFDSGGGRKEAPIGLGCAAAMSFGW